MAGKPTIVKTLTLEALDKYPKAASKAIARALCKEHPAVFANINQARLAVNRCRGAQGKHNRAFTTNARPRKPSDAEQCKQWGSLMPIPEPNAWGWRQLPEGVGQWLVLADLHIPFHSPEAIEAALRFAEGRCDGVLLLGDVADCYSLSPWLRDPRMRRFDQEVNGVAKFLDMLREWGAKHIAYKAGNHELRLERYLQSRAAELFGLDVFSFQRVLDLEQRGVTWIDAMDPIGVAKLSLVHGHEYHRGLTSPVNPARGLYLKAHDCTLAAHEHRTSEHTEPSIRGVTVTCWSVGCLADLHPRYRPLNPWNHGFAILDLSSGDWAIENYRIVDGQVKT